MRVLVLDDEQYRHDEFARRFKGHDVTQARTATEALDALRGPAFDVAQLDHDLGHGNGSGMDVARFIASMPAVARPRVVRVHSWNPPAAALMVAWIREAGGAAALDPFRCDDPIFDGDAE